MRIGKIDGNFVVNPDEEALLEGADLDLIVAGTEEAILMVEAGANEIPEAEILDALDIAHDNIKKLCAAQRELAEKAGKAKTEVEVPQVHRRALRADQGLARRALCPPPPRSRTSSSARTPPRPSRSRSSSSTPALPESETYAEYRSNAQRAFDKLEKTIIREHIAVEKKRPDGRTRGADPPDLDRGRRGPPHARLGAVHPRPDAGVHRRRARHHA